MANDLMNPKGNDLVKAMEDFFAKAPQLPKGGRDVLVTIAPWLALIFGILGVLAGLSLIGVSFGASFLGVREGAMGMLAGLLAFLSSIIMLIAFPKLNKREMGGWMLLFWSEVISVVSSLFGGGIVGAIIGGLIGFYILFQMKPEYK